MRASQRTNARRRDGGGHVSASVGLVEISIPFVFFVRSLSSAIAKPRGICGAPVPKLRDRGRSPSRRFCGLWIGYSSRIDFSIGSYEGIAIELRPLITWTMKISSSSSWPGHEHRTSPESACFESFVRPKL
ncbi:hypothetical protein NL676_028221 [Syzygium grande]|nr:hypothetical protein NL676_028221 [Syzygium grande]